MKTPIPFVMTVNASAMKTQCSQRITYPFRITKITTSFPIGCEENLPVRVIVSEDKTIPTDAPPEGQNVFQILGGNVTLQGNAQRVPMQCDIPFLEAGKYIKVFGENKDAVNGHTVIVTVEIETIKIVRGTVQTKGGLNA